MAEAASEMSHYPEYDYVIVNDDLEVSVSRVQSILAAERCKRDRLVGLAAFVHGLQAGY
jgi:guanylate kinase